jgi:folate-binding protein YgfZ
MNETTEILPETQATIITGVTAEAAPLTPLAMLSGASTGLVEARGARTRAVFSDAAAELSALVTGTAVFDAGARVRLRITGEDRVRWLNGMVTNTVKSLAPGEHNYTFVLNAQGRIQGDATVFAFAGHLILETDRAQAERLYAHFDRFIIMDDVELSWIEGQTTLGLAGPNAETLLAALGLPVPAAGCFAAVAGDRASVVVGEAAGHVRRFSIWVPEAAALNLWQQMIEAGTTPAGALAVDAVRVLEGTPLYGVDISEKTLAQETGQMRALNFNKGCYLGQEIVERVRSRANVHRGIRQFALYGAPAAPGTPITAQETAAGELTSVADIALQGYQGQLGLGLVRVEALGRPLGYPGGSIEVLAASPLGSI